MELLEKIHNLLSQVEMLGIQQEDPFPPPFQSEVDGVLGQIETAMEAIERLQADMKGAQGQDNPSQLGVSL